MRKFIDSLKLAICSLNMYDTTFYLALGAIFIISSVMMS
jgi:hypothetical protein